MLEAQHSASEFTFRNFCAEDIAILSGVRLRWLRVKSSKLKALPELEYEARSHVFLQECSLLADLGNISSASLELESCNSVDHNSLQLSPNLIQLILRGQKALSSFDFLAQLQNLRVLWATAIKPRRICFDGLGQSKSLKFVWLSPLSAKALRELSERNEPLLMTNGEVCCRNGEMIGEGAVFWEELAEAGLYGLGKWPAAAILK